MLRNRQIPGGDCGGDDHRVEANRTAVGQVDQLGPFAAVDLAGTEAGDDRLGALADTLRDAGLDVTVRDDEAVILWEKLALVAPLALLTTYAGAPVGVARSDLRADLLACVAEITQVTKAEGAEVDLRRVIATFDAAPASMQSSMQRDAAAGRPTELDANRQRGGESRGSARDTGASHRPVRRCPPSAGILLRL